MKLGLDILALLMVLGGKVVRRFGLFTVLSGHIELMSSGRADISKSLIYAVKSRSIFLRLAMVYYLFFKSWILVY